MKKKILYAVVIAAMACACVALDLWLSDVPEPEYGLANRLWFGVQLMILGVCLAVVFGMLLARRGKGKQAAQFRKKEANPPVFDARRYAAAMIASAQRRKARRKWPISWQGMIPVVMVLLMACMTLPLALSMMPSDVVVKEVPRIENPSEQPQAAQPPVSSPDSAPTAAPTTEEAPSVLSAFMLTVERPPPSIWEKWQDIGGRYVAPWAVAVSLLAIACLVGHAFLWSFLQSRLRKPKAQLAPSAR